MFGWLKQEGFSKKVVKQAELDNSRLDAIKVEDRLDKSFIRKVRGTQPKNPKLEGEISRAEQDIIDRAKETEEIKTGTREAKEEDLLRGHVVIEKEPFNQLESQGEVETIIHAGLEPVIGEEMLVHLAGKGKKEILVEIIEVQKLPDNQEYLVVFRKKYHD